MHPTVLDTVVGVAAGDSHPLIDIDPFAPHDALPDSITAIHDAAAEQDDAEAARAPDAQQSAAWLPRVALCVELRDPALAGGNQPDEVKKPASPRSGKRSADEPHIVLAVAATEWCRDAKHRLQRCRRVSMTVMARRISTFAVTLVLGTTFPACAPRASP